MGKRIEFARRLTYHPNAFGKTVNHLDSRITRGEEYSVNEATREAYGIG